MSILCLGTDRLVNENHSEEEKCKFRFALVALSDGNALGNTKAVAAFSFLKIMPYFPAPILIWIKIPSRALMSQIVLQTWDSGFEVK